MIRTRDLVIFVSVLLFVIVGIAVTFISDIEQKSTFSFFVTPLSTQDEGVYAAEKPEVGLNRASIIDRLREAITLGSSAVVPSPSVEESEESVSEEDVPELHSLQVQYCPVQKPLDVLVRDYPKKDVRLSVADMKRLVLHTKTIVGTSTLGTSSTPVRTEKEVVLLEMPAYPVALGESCIESDVIGVTTRGTPLLNSSAAEYRGYGPDYLIGYARDGFPVYGSYQGEVDACGGYMHAAGYRYSLTSGRDFILGCYKGIPSSFVTQ